MANKDEINTPTDTLAVTIAATISGALDLGGMRPVGIVTPAAWTVGSITFQASADGTNFYDVLTTTGGEVALTNVPTGAAAIIPLNPPSYAGLRYLKVRSGTSAATVTQGASRTLTLMLQRY